MTLSRAADRWLRARGARPCAVQDLLDLRLDRCRQHRTGRPTRSQADAGDAIVLVTPAFPETGRTVYQGNLFVGAVPLERKPAEGSSAQPDARCQSGAGARRGRAATRSAWSISFDGREGCRTRSARGWRSSPASGIRAGDRRRGVRIAISSPSGLRRSTIASRSAPPASGSGWRAGSSPAAACARLRRLLARRAARRAGRMPRGKLLAGDARADRARPKPRCRCCGSIRMAPSSPTRRWSTRRSPGRSSGSIAAPC